MITQPMLAATYRDELPKFPLLATPKVDGVRALIVGGKLVSRSFKPIPNDKIRNVLEDILPEGADGELSYGSLYDTTSVVMSKNADFKVLSFYWFDWAYDMNAPYETRSLALVNETQRIKKRLNYPCVLICPLLPKSIDNILDLQYYESYVLNNGFEGLVVRRPDGRYKCGRSTLKEGLMVKIKRYEDYEATVVAAEELMINTNESQADNFGHAKKSRTKAGLCKSGRLGAIVAATEDGDVFRIGTGFTDAQRRSLWIDRRLMLGRLVKYRCTDKGMKNLPRCPVFAGFRHTDDLN
jgi:DNA ligase-1